MASPCSAITSENSLVCASRSPPSIEARAESPAASAIAVTKGGVTSTTTAVSAKTMTRSRLSGRPMIPPKPVRKTARKKSDSGTELTPDDATHREAGQGDSGEERPRDHRQAEPFRGADESEQGRQRHEQELLLAQLHAEDEHGRHPADEGESGPDQDHRGCHPASSPREPFRESAEDGQKQDDEQVLEEKNAKHHPSERLEHLLALLEQADDEQGRARGEGERQIARLSQRGAEDRRDGEPDDSEDHELGPADP
jgi:hypothetical protein